MATNDDDEKKLEFAIEKLKNLVKEFNLDYSSPDIEDRVKKLEDKVDNQRKDLKRLYNKDRNIGRRVRLLEENSSDSSDYE